MYWEQLFSELHPVVKAILLPTANFQCSLCRLTPQRFDLRDTFERTLVFKILPSGLFSFQQFGKKYIKSVLQLFGSFNSLSVIPMIVFFLFQSKKKPVS